MEKITDKRTNQRLKITLRSFIKAIRVYISKLQRERKVASTLLEP